MRFCFDVVQNETIFKNDEFEFLITLMLKETKIKMKWSMARLRVNTFYIISVCVCALSILKLIIMYSKKQINYKVNKKWNL